MSHPALIARPLGVHLAALRLFRMAIVMDCLLTARRAAMSL